MVSFNQFNCPQTMCPTISITTSSSNSSSIGSLWFDKKRKKHPWTDCLSFIIMMMMMMTNMSQCQQLQQQQQAMLSMSSLIDASSTKMIIINDRFKRQSSSLSDSHHHHHSSTIKLQRFLIEPENLTVNIGESIILPCRVSNKAGTVQCKFFLFSPFHHQSNWISKTI